MTGSQIDKAHDLAIQYAKQWWKEAPGDLEFHHLDTLPEGGYNAPDDRHHTEQGWYHFAAVYSNRIGSTTYLSVHPESGEVRSAVIGE